MTSEQTNGLHARILITFWWHKLQPQLLY